jgi:hypothetical protein
LASNECEPAFSVAYALNLQNNLKQKCKVKLSKHYYQRPRVQPNICLPFTAHERLLHFSLSCTVANNLLFPMQLAWQKLTANIQRATISWLWETEMPSYPGNQTRSIFRVVHFSAGWRWLSPSGDRDACTANTLVIVMINTTGNSECDSKQQREETRTKPILYRFGFGRIFGSFPNFWPKV